MFKDIYLRDDEPNSVCYIESKIVSSPQIFDFN